jgi:hypothetical protein
MVPGERLQRALDPPAASGGEALAGARLQQGGQDPR